MKRCFFALALFVLFLAPSAKAPMVRVIDVIDARTIVVDDNGRHTTVVITGVALADTEEAEAAAYLRRLVFGQWVLVESGGFVYRSPDALCVNGEMARHPWRGVPRFIYLGTVDPGKARKAPPTPKAAPATTVDRPLRVRRKGRPSAAVSSAPGTASNAMKGTTTWHAEPNASPSAPPP